MTVTAQTPPSVPTTMEAAPVLDCRPKLAAALVVAHHLEVPDFHLVPIQAFDFYPAIPEDTQ